LKKRNNRGRREMPGSKYIINDKIRATEVRIIEGLPSGVYSIEDALQEVENLGLDLVVTNLNTSPPICKAVDFKKFLYQEKQKTKDLEKNQVKVVIKEVRFTPNIGENDYQVKKRKAIEFLDKGFKVKASVFFKGRTIMFKDKGEIVLLRLAQELEDVGIPEGVPKMESRNRMGFIIKPKK
jgi:translation initiation factor IF-3